METKMLQSILNIKLQIKNKFPDLIIRTTLGNSNLRIFYRKGAMSNTIIFIDIFSGKVYKDKTEMRQDKSIGIVDEINLINKINL